MLDDKPAGSRTPQSRASGRFHFWNHLCKEGGESRVSMDRAAWSYMHAMGRANEGANPFTKATLKRVLRFAVPYRGRILVFILVSILAAAVSVATPVLAGQVVDAIVARSGLGPVAFFAVLIGLLAIADAGLSLVARWLSSVIGEGVILDLRRAVFDHVQKMPIAFFMRTRTGALVSRLNNDVIGAQSAFAGTLSGIVSNSVSLILTVGVMLQKSWLVTVLSLLILPLFLFPARRMGLKIADMRREAAAYNAAMGNQMTERFSAPGATLIKLFGRPDEESTEFAAKAKRVRDIGVRSAVLAFAFITSLTLVSSLALAVVYGVGGWLAVGGQMAAGDVVVLALLLTKLYAPITSLSNARVDIMSALVSFERVFEVLDLVPLIREKDDARPLPEGPVSVEFDDVRFAYPSADKVSLASLEEVAVLDTRGGEEVLHGLSFRVQPGQTIALVGSSGAGKSTTAQLIARLYDVDSGAVRIGGIDVRDTTFASLRQTVGMVTQDGHLFHESIGTNLRLAAPVATDAELWDALRRARLDDMVRALPDGLETIVGERGYRLSGGERQRLTIARLLLAQPRVVILDEATASLDSTNEAAVQAALTEALEGRTALVIAHRLSTIRAADEILVMEGGRIVERGTHPDLLAANGRYAELYNTQFAEAVAVAEEASR